MGSFVPILQKPVETIFNQCRILHILIEINKDSLKPHPLMILL
jgi:hypothetical protein